MRVTLSEAGRLLTQGAVVAVPTETVYGLAASLRHSEAIKQVYALKVRPPKNPLILHVPSASSVKEYIQEIPQHFEELTASFWPGPMTLVMPAKPGKLPEIATAGLITAAFRVPSHPMTLELLNLTGPLVMPSANLSGKPSATSAEHVEADFGKDFPVLDGGQCHQGVESTILFWDGTIWVVARLGALPPSTFVKVLGYEPKVVVSGDAPICPGQMYRHYAPAAVLVLTREVPEEGSEAVIGFSDRRYPSHRKLYSLGSSLDPSQAANRLYGVLRQLDVDGIEFAYVDVDFPENGLWLTLKERLLKAARTIE